MNFFLASDSPVLAIPHSNFSSSGFGLFNISPVKLPRQTFDKTCTALISRRKRPANLAFHALTRIECEELGLNRPGILDSRAKEVHDAILLRGNQVPSVLQVSFGYSTVYHTPRLTTDEMTILYNFDFHDVDTFDSLRRTPLMISAIEVELLGNFNAAEWLISKGANSLREVTFFGATPLHYIASTMATYFVMNLKLTGTGELRLSRESTSKLEYGIRFIIRENGQDVKDNCKCGCSMNGCSPLHLFLKCAIRDIHNGPTCRCQAVRAGKTPSPEQCEQELNKALYYFVDHLLGIRYGTGKISDSTYHEILNLFIFRVLGLTHTCCKTHRWSPAITQPKVMEEVQEIQDKERQILFKLGNLYKEGTDRRADYDGPFSEFLADFLSEIRERPGVSLDENEIRKLEEIGVVFQRDNYE